MSSVHFRYDGTQEAGYQAFASYAVFVNCAQKNQQYHAFLATNQEMDTFDFYDPISYQATMKKKDPDLPMYYEALTGPDCEAFYEAMAKEICELVAKNTWTLVKQSDMKARHQKAVLSTWAFHCK